MLYNGCMTVEEGLRVPGDDKGESRAAEWLASRTDPVRDVLADTGGKPDLDFILGLYPPTEGDPAFDPTVIKSNVERLKTFPEVNTGHLYLDLSVRTGLAHIDATFQADHPKYGIKYYGEGCHDGFPPIIIAAVDALTAWGLNARAVQLFRYWVLHFVRDDGWIHYRGTSLCELGQLLHTAALLEQRAGQTGWWADSAAGLERIAENLLNQWRKGGGLLSGVPEDDEKDKVGAYFHNNAWVAAGLSRWAELCERRGYTAATPPEAVRKAAESLRRMTLDAIVRHWPADPADWWLVPQVEPVERPESLTATRIASYTNYRYWPELLASGILPADLANRVVEARLSAGGQFCGMTRFLDRLDDWPLADYLHGLWHLGRKDDFLLSLYGHVACHQARGHLTAYEQVSLPPGRERWPYCLPCQLVAARAARLLVKG